MFKNKYHAVSTVSKGIIFTTDILRHKKLGHDRKEENNKKRIIKGEKKEIKILLTSDCPTFILYIYLYIFLYFYRYNRKRTYTQFLTFAIMSK